MLKIVITENNITLDHEMDVAINIAHRTVLDLFDQGDVSIEFKGGSERYVTVRPIDRPNLIVFAISVEQDWSQGVEEAGYFIATLDSDESRTKEELTFPIEPEIVEDLVRRGFEQFMEYFLDSAEGKWHDKGA
tara:strand:- start:266 stop:664 length:399 start_codon:yes stop_codon:yes gene_type:complete